MTLPRNIAIVGRMYAGKTTLANALVRDFGYTRVAMAGPLKQLAFMAYGEDVVKDKEYATTDLNTGDVTFKSGRAILQGIGQSIKVVDRDIWLKMFIADTAHMKREPYVVDDVRFGFEADYLRDNGWGIVMVKTPDWTRIQRAKFSTGRVPTPEELNHESEREVDNIKADYLYIGEGLLSNVPDRAEEIVKTFR